MLTHFRILIQFSRIDFKTLRQLCEKEIKSLSFRNFGSPGFLDLPDQ